MFWYPPGGVREWHTNNHDLVGNTNNKIETSNREEQIFASQEWRLYYIRTVRDTDFDAKLQHMKTRPADAHGHSAFHIVPGKDNGITLQVLENAGARRLTSQEKKRQWWDEFAEPYSNQIDSTGKSFNETVWRLPDLDGYVTLFRLPYMWHCIVSEEVHRYS